MIKGEGLGTGRTSHTACYFIHIAQSLRCRERVTVAYLMVYKGVPRLEGTAGKGCSGTFGGYCWQVVGVNVGRFIATLRIIMIPLETVGIYEIFCFCAELAQS